MIFFVSTVRSYENMASISRQRSPMNNIASACKTKGSFWWLISDLLLSRVSMDGWRVFLSTSRFALKTMKGRLSFSSFVYCATNVTNIAIECLAIVICSMNNIYKNIEEIFNVVLWHKSFDPQIVYASHSL